MDHVVYVDAKAKELAEILNRNKTMIIRGAAGRKMPYGRVCQGDTLYLIENDGSGLVDVVPEITILLIMTVIFLTIGASLFTWNK